MGFSKKVPKIFGTATFDNICEELKERKVVPSLDSSFHFFSAIIHKSLKNILSLQTFQVFAFFQFELGTQQYPISFQKEHNSTFKL